MKPKDPCTHWPQSTYVGTTFRPKYILSGCMDPLEKPPQYRLAGLVDRGVGLGFRPSKP